jgi:hypothetical protein
MIITVVNICFGLFVARVLNVKLLVKCLLLKTFISTRISISMFSCLRIEALNDATDDDARKQNRRNERKHGNEWKFPIVYFFL